MMTDIEIAKACKMKPIKEVAENAGILEDELEYYGKYKAKLSDDLFARMKDAKDGKLILVTAINPTPAGEGKTTVSVGLAEGMAKIGKNAMLALREPSLGPVFGVKGGAAGGGYAQVVPMEDLNLHFTGDLHAVTSANNLLCAMVDNHLQQGNTLNIDPRKVTFKRVLDMNDRALRDIVIGLGGSTNGVPRQAGFMITAASEIMATLCLAEDLGDLKERLASIIVGYRYDDTPVFARDLNAQGAMATLLKDAIKPNLVQTIEGTPCIIHGGPFANIAHGCNTIRATKIAMKLGDYAITEAGFGADLGAQKFLDIKCRKAGLKPDCIVLVATVRAMKYNGGVPRAELQTENVEALKKGLCNLEAHIQNLKQYQVPIVVAMNRFASDTDNELAVIRELCDREGVKVAMCEVFAKGGEGGTELAKLVCDVLETEKSNFKLLYPDEMSIEEKIRTIAQKIYGADDVIFEPKAAQMLPKIKALGFDSYPVCIAKTQYSLSDDASLLGRPKGYNVTIRDLTVSGGPGFVVAIAGNIMTMPGLPKVPAAENIDIDNNGSIDGLF